MEKAINKMEKAIERNHWLCRVGDGENFRNSKYPFWAIKPGECGGFKTTVKKIKTGDILWFITPKKYGNKIIGMSEYCNFYDRRDEPLLKIYTKTNDEQNWKGADAEKWHIEIHYCNFYNTERYNFIASIQCGAHLMEVDKHTRSRHSNINVNLYDEYKNITSYT